MKNICQIFLVFLFTFIQRLNNFLVKYWRRISFAFIEFFWKIAKIFIPFLKKSRLLVLLYERTPLIWKQFSVFKDKHYIFDPVYSKRYTMVEIIDDFITYWYRAYRRLLRAIFYPIPGCKRLALFLKKNFLFVRTRTWIILSGIAIAFVIWSLMKYGYRKFRHFIVPISFVYFGRKLQLFLNSAEFEDWNILFKDPATVYAHALIDLHDLTMWYIFIVLGVVCWSLYAILKNCVWNVANKNFGVSSGFYAFYSFSRIESFLVYIWFKVYSRATKVFFDWISKDTEKNTLLMTYYIFNIDVDFEKELLFFIYGSERFAKGLAFPKLYGPRIKARRPLNRKRIYYYVKEKYLDFKLFSVSTYGEFFYDSKSELLAVRRFRHSTLLEIIWASFPTAIIILILIPSLYLLYSAEEDLDPEFTLKVIGHQWYWSYEYTDTFDYFFGNYSGSVFKTFKFDSYLVLDEDLNLGEKRILEVSNRIVLPTNIVLRILVTSSDVLHAWAVPEMGIKIDAVPGRLNQTLSILLRPGIFYGQCSELCGIAHGFMPIVVHAVTPREFGCWGFWQL